MTNIPATAPTPASNPNAVPTTTPTTTPATAPPATPAPQNAPAGVPLESGTADASTVQALRTQVADETPLIITSRTAHNYPTNPQDT